MLTVKCPNCGSNNTFDEHHVASFCSYCGGALPDMKDLIKQQLAHQNELETIEQKDKLSYERMKFIERESKRNNRSTIIILLICIGIPLFIWFFIIIAK